MPLPGYRSRGFIGDFALLAVTSLYFSFMAGLINSEVLSLIFSVIRLKNYLSINNIYRLRRLAERQSLSALVYVIEGCI